MGTPGPPGAYDPHKYFRGSPQGPYPPQTSGYQPSSPGNSFHHQPSHSYPPGSIPPGSFSQNTSMYPGSPVLNYPYSTTQFSQAGSSLYHGPQYGHYNQDHSPRQDPHLASQFTQQSTQLPSSPSHTNQSRIPISAPPPPTYPQSRSSQPMPSLPPALPQGTDRFNPVSSQPLDGARLMALLTTQSEGEGAEVYEETVCLPGAPQSSPRPPLFPFRHIPVDPSHSIGTEMPGTPPPMHPSLAHSVQGRQAPKVQRGRHLRGDYVTYDVDARKAGDPQAELVVNPITIYSSESTLVLGRQIAVNKKFVCYGLRGGQIRILNINSSQRILLRGHTQRVTDMVFFSEDVPMLASASQDGRIYVRKIVESHEENGKLSDQTLLALQFLGNWEKCHPRLCWHSQKQDLLVVAIGKFVIVIDIYHVATPGGFNVDVPVECRMENPIRGVHVIGQHDDDVTELASCASVATSLATASKDGTVRLWGDRKQSPQSAIAPFAGNFVDAVAFLPSPRGTDGHVLLTGGPLNRDLKLWTLDDQSIQSGHAVWRCIQTLEFQSNTKPDIAFFNHVVVSSRANLILLANAKRNAIYVAHVDFSSPSGGPRIDYVTEHSVTMHPILSFTVADDGVSESGEGILKIFCLQTHGIYQYALDMSQCLPNLIDGDGSTPNTPKKSLGMMPVAATPVSSSFPASDKTHPRPMPNPITSTGVSSSSISNPGIPPRPTALGNLIELGHSSAPESIKAFDASKLTLLRDPKDVGPGKPGSPGAHSMPESGGQPGNRGITRPDSTREVLPPSNLSKPPTPPPMRSRRNNLYSRSTAKVPGSTGPPRYKVEKMDETKEILLDTEASADTIQSSLNSNSIELESGDQEDKDGISSTGTGDPAIPQQQMGPQLLSPSDIMSIAAGSKRDDAPPQETGYDLMDVSDWQDGAKVGNVPWPSDELAPDREDTSDFPIPHFDSPDGQGGAATECFEKEITTEGDNESAAIDWQGRGTGDESQDSDLIDDKERPTPDDLQDQLKNMALKLDRQAGNAAAGVLSPTSSAGKGRKNKNKSGGAATVPLPTSLQLRLNSAMGSPGEAGSNSTQGPMSLIAQVESMQDSIFQLIEMQKQIITTVATPVIKEGKRLEGVLGQRLEKVMKANADSMWVRLNEENAKREKQDRERMLQITSLLNDLSAKDLPAALELGLKKEVAAIAANIAQTLVVPVQNAVSAALTECFQKNLTEKVMPHMEKTVLSKLEATMTKQLKFQFQTSGKQALQDGIRTSFESLIIPGFERSCQTMFDQVNTVFQTEMIEHSSQIERELSSTHTALATNLQDLISGASSLVKDLNDELVQSMTKLLRLVKTAGSTGEVNQHKDNLPDKVHSLRRVEESLDPTIELNRLLHAGMLEEAFNKALKAGDLQIVFWLCHQLEPVPLLSADPLPVSQGVLLSLVQQLSSDLSRDTGHKLRWIKEATLALNPRDPLISPHMHSFLELAYQNCHRQMGVSKDPSEQVTLRLVIHVMNSLLSSCK